jgi:hypothetical protein
MDAIPDVLPRMSLRLPPADVVETVVVGFVDDVGGLDVVVCDAVGAEVEVEVVPPLQPIINRAAAIIRTGDTRSAFVFTNPLIHQCSLSIRRLSCVVNSNNLSGSNAGCLSSHMKELKKGVIKGERVGEEHLELRRGWKSADRELEEILK